MSFESVPLPVELERIGPEAGDFNLGGGLMPGAKGWFGKLLKSDGERAERRPAEKFAAYRWTGSAVKQDPVRDISSTGVYLYTNERWPLGAYLSLTLQRIGPLEKSPERRITALAKVVRSGEDGVGLWFVGSKDPASRQWEHLLESLVQQTQPEDMVSLVKMAEALGFLSRICPGGAQEVGQLVRGRLSNHKVANAMAIALHAESMVASPPAADNVRARSAFVVRILEEGSCTDEDWLHQYWGGLLATSCTPDGKDESNLHFAEILSQLPSIPIRILTVVCTRAIKFVSDTGLISAKPLACDMAEIRAITGAKDFQIKCDIERLATFGLIDKNSARSPTMLSSEETLITPTSFGLSMFARCKGHPGEPHDYYLEKPPGTPVGANRQSW